MTSLTFPITKTSNNVFNRKHWRGKHELNTQIKNDVFYSVREQKVAPVKDYPVQIDFVFFLVGRLIDADNCSSIVKSAIDGLRDADVLEDDSSKYFRKFSVETQESDTGEDYCLIQIKKWLGTTLKGSARATSASVKKARFSGLRECQ